MFTKAVVASVEDIAKTLKVEPAALLAVAEVESAGVAEWNVKGVKKPAIRFEGHYFYRKLKGAKLKQAIAQGLANSKAGAVRNPSNYAARYDLLSRAMKIDAAAAIESTSWGLGQVMGDHWRKLGYASAEALMDVAFSGVDGQIEIMAKYIQKFSLADELRRKDWTGFAKAYNGPAYRKNRYDTKMAAAYARWSKGGSTASDGPTKGIQTDLKRLGYYKGNVDGIMGPKTKDAVRAFQKDEGLVVDGKYGKMTDGAVDRAIAKLNRKDADDNVKSGAGVMGTGAITEMLSDQSQKLEAVAPYADVITYVVVAMVLAGAVLTLLGVWQKYKSNEVDDS